MRRNPKKYRKTLKEKTNEMANRLGAASTLMRMNEDEESLRTATLMREASIFIQRLIKYLPKEG